MSPDGNIGVVASPLLGDINLAKSLVEEVVEAFVDVIRLGHHHCVAFDGRVTNGSNRVDLKEGKRGEGDREGEDGGKDGDKDLQTLLPWHYLSGLPTTHLL